MTRARTPECESECSMYNANKVLPVYWINFSNYECF